MKYWKKNIQNLSLVLDLFMLGLHLVVFISTCGGDGIRDGLNPKKARISMGKSMFLSPLRAATPKATVFDSLGNLFEGEICI